MRISDSDLSTYVSMKDMQTSTAKAHLALLSVLGPDDACRLNEMRQLVRPYVDFGAPEPVDVFLMSLGYPEASGYTQIGGLPCYGRDRKWPTSDDSKEHLPFLAQFALHESIDLVKSAADGDMLLIFGHADGRSGYKVEWEDSKRVSLVREDDIPVSQFGTLCYYGSPWRTDSFPHATVNDEAHWSSIRLANGIEIRDLPFLCCLLAVQIGGFPYVPAHDDVVNDSERVLCSICSLSPTPDRPYPFLNHPSPMDNRQARDATLILGPDLDSDSFGVLYVVDASGTVQVRRRSL
jgi:hypothetical protein